MKPYAEFNGSYGSFNTHKETVKVGTGLLNNHWTFDARLSNIGTDGYIDRASVDLNSYYLQGGYFAENTSVKLIAFAGKEKTYHAWGYATKEQMEKFGRRYNPCGEMYTDANGKNIITTTKQIIICKKELSASLQSYFLDSLESERCLYIIPKVTVITKSTKTADT